VTTWKLIRREFRAHFSHWNLSLPRSLSRGRGVITGGGGWHIRWRTRTVRGRAHLDFYATHRMTNDRHCRIRQDGTVMGLPAASNWILYPMGASENDRAKLDRRRARRNERIRHLLMEKFGVWT